MSSSKFLKNTYKPYHIKQQYNGKNNSKKQSTIYNSIVCISNLY